MAVFAVIAPEFNAQLKEAIDANFGGENNYEIAPGQYLVAGHLLTSHQVSTMLGAPGGGVGRVIILRVTSHTGWHARDMWEWITTRQNPSAAPETEAPGGQ